MTASTAEKDAAAYAAWETYGRNFIQAAGATGTPRSSFRDAVKRHQARLDQDATVGDSSDETGGYLGDAVPAAGSVTGYSHDGYDDSDESFERLIESAPAADPFPDSLLSPEPAEDAPVVITEAEQEVARQALRDVDPAAGKRPQPSPCLCGCGETAKWTFVRGHGSRYAKQIRTDYAAGDMSREQVLEAAAAGGAKFRDRVAATLDRADARAEYAATRQARRPRSLGWLTEVSVVGKGGSVQVFKAIVQAGTPQDAYLAAQNALSVEAAAFALFTLYEPDELAEVAPGYLFHVGDRSSVTIRHLDAVTAG